jgi:hypothetical protein
VVLGRVRALPASPAKGISMKAIIIAGAILATFAGAACAGEEPTETREIILQCSTPGAIVRCNPVTHVTYYGDSYPYYGSYTHYPKRSHATSGDYARYIVFLDSSDGNMRIEWTRCDIPYRGAPTMEWARSSFWLALARFRHRLRAFP